MDRLSEAVYKGLCLKMGTPQQVAVRREAVDVSELFINELNKENPAYRVKMMSGSDREGFRLKTSDVDIMYWRNNHRVLWDFSQAQFYNPDRYSLILCDNSDSPPGYTLLWLPLEEANNEVLSACVRLNGALYLSSIKYRTVMISASTPDSILHGPSCSEFFGGVLECDHVHCLVSDFWPPSASSWIDRCQSWPPSYIVDDIRGHGCHFVALGHELGNHSDVEWRISFSRAEHKLVYAMNHTQFLTYGLLKIFIREINIGMHVEERLLCSYHMKTVILWAIQQIKTIEWCPKNLLEGFWVCLKHLLKWVHEGVCPHFFIPENNLFLNKVYGVRQRHLFTKLLGLYEKGISFLLQIPSICAYILPLLCNPRLHICTDERTLISEILLDYTVFREMDKNLPLLAADLPTCFRALKLIQQMENLSLTSYQYLVLQKHKATVLQNTAYLYHEMSIQRCGNKQMHRTEKMSFNMLKLASNLGFVSDTLVVAMFLYKTYEYKKALSFIDNIKNSFLMCRNWVDSQIYAEAVGGLSWSDKMREAVAWDITLNNKIVYINELVPEQKSALQNELWMLCIPPHVLLYMLEFLCYRHTDPIRAQEALNNLHILVLFDGVPKAFRDISWEILGICHQMTGNHQAALFAYQQSLGQHSTHKIYTATIHRIQDL